MAGAQVAACVAVFLLSVPLTLSGATGDAFDEPPTFFTVAPAVFVGVIVGSVCKRTAGRRITKAGAFALHTARVAHGPAATGAALRPAGLVVALGGTALLTDELLRQQLAEAQRAQAYTGSGTTSGGSSGYDSGWSSPGDGAASWCGSSDGGSGSGCGSSSSGGSSCGSSSSGSSCGSGSSSCGGSSSGGSSCGGGYSCGS